MMRAQPAMSVECEPETCDREHNAQDEGGAPDKRTRGRETGHG